MVTCPRCGAPLSSTDRVCPDCGVDLAAMRRFFTVSSGPRTPAGYLIAAVVCGVLAVLFWVSGVGLAALISGGVGVLALLIAVIGRGVEVGQRANRRD